MLQKSMRRRLVLVGAAVGLAALAGGVPTSLDASTQAPQFRGAVDVIQLDVSVLDKNRRPIRGLTTANFTVLEDGKPQHIVTTAEIDAAERDPALSAWMRHVPHDIATNDLVDQAGDGRLFGIVLDDHNTPYDDAAVEMAMRSAARYIVDGLGPSDLAAVVYVQDAGKTQDFTDDRAKLLVAIDRFQAHEPEWVGSTPTGPGPGGGDMVQRFAPSMARSRCLRAQPVIPTLDTVVSRLAIVPQKRKTLIFLGPGVPLTFGGLGPGCQSELSDIMKDVFWKAQRGNVNIYGIDPSGYRGYENALVDRMVRQGRASGIDSQQMASSAARVRHDFLQAVAENTGGRAVIDTDGITEAVDAIFDEDGSYYLVGYQTSNGKPDGKFRRVQVKVSVPGATVRTRSGYWATRAGALTTSREKETPTSLDLGLTGMESPAGLPLRAIATPVGPADPSGASHDADVAVVLTVRMPSPKQAASETLTIVRNVYDADNHTGPPARETVTLTLQPGSGDDLRYDVRQHLRLAPGRYQIRLNGHSALLDRGGTVYADVEVPDFSGAAILLTPIVLGTAPDGDPARADGLAAILPIVPTTARDFAPNEHATAYVRLMQGGTGALLGVTISTQVLDQHSTVVAESTVALAPDAFGAARTAAYQFEVPLEGRSHGPHLLSISARLPDGRTARRDLVFRVR